MKKTVLLHGSTNCRLSNYGDYVYAELLYQHISEKGYKVLFWQLSAFFTDKLKDYNDVTQTTKMQSDALVYIPGGYFGEGHNAKFYENIRHFYRFMPIGLKFIKKQKKIGVVGIGAGPNNSPYLRWAIKKICNKAFFISVRDKVSFEAIKSLCPQANLFECSDLIIAPSSNIKKYESTEQIHKLFTVSKGSKILLVHYNTHINALNLFAETLKFFINIYSEYHVVVASDSVVKNEYELYKQFTSKFNHVCSHFIYDDPAEMTTLLSKVDVVLTCKLHVGVIACLFNKSVIVAAVHPEKTKRFYNQIGEDKRCVSLFETSKDDLFDMLSQYHNKKVSIPKTEFSKAEQNWELLDRFLDNL